MAALTPLRKRADFLRIAGGRRKVVTPGLILQPLPRPETQPAIAGTAIRVGYTATKKIGIAVTRNRAKRRLRAAAAAILAPHAATDFDYVLIARAETPSRPYPALLKDLETALRRSGTWRSQ